MQPRTSSTATGTADMSFANTAQPSSRPAHTSSMTRTRPGGCATRDQQAEQAADQERRHRRLQHHAGVVAEQERVEGEDQAGERGDHGRRHDADDQVAQQHHQHAEGRVHPAQLEDQVHGRAVQVEQPDRRGVQQHAPGRVQEERHAEERGQPAGGEHRREVGVGELVDEQVVRGGETERADGDRDAAPPARRLSTRATGRPAGERRWAPAGRGGTACTGGSAGNSERKSGARPGSGGRGARRQAPRDGGPRGSGPGGDVDAEGGRSRSGGGMRGGSGRAAGAVGRSGCGGRRRPLPDAGHGRPATARTTRSCRAAAASQSNRGRTRAGGRRR